MIMCTSISIDALFVMYAIGGAMLGWLGMRSWKKYNNRGKDTDAKPSSTKEIESFTTNGN